MIPSRDATKSVKTLSTWSIPANNVIMSEPGFVYFFARMVERKVVNVCSEPIRVNVRLLLVPYSTTKLPYL